MAAALAFIDREERAGDINDLLDAAYLLPRGKVLGLTGPPGVGKSTLINSLIQQFRARGLTVGVIAVDPSSQISRGALLGDRVRMRTDPEDQGVFVRSLAARGRLGGLSEIAFAATVLMRAVYDWVFVETVGVGQSEADIASVADTVVLCIQPGSGDSMQFMKAGIMEIPHIAAVTKADAGPAASRALAELKGALGLASAPDPSWEVPCLMVSAARNEGVSELIQYVEQHAAKLSSTGELARKRHRQAEMWLTAMITSAYGRHGATLLGSSLKFDPDQAPFGVESRLASTLRVTRV
ncbi:MAG: methylmalonyl Co-A mutase-associated GTPase MeaB [Hyphomicrobiales bacterium]|nr:methylmalonyl Co-A mutase-associated GTPase MeaB [Hyphomicrobiales bacterium]